MLLLLSYYRLMLKVFAFRSNTEKQIVGHYQILGMKNESILHP